ISWYGTSYGGLPFWRNATGEETVNGNPVGIVNDPSFVDSTGSSDQGLKLNTGSPAIGAGLNLFTVPYLYKWDPYGLATLGLPIYPSNDGVPRDYFGTSLNQKHGYDIGAYESMG